MFNHRLQTVGKSLPSLVSSLAILFSASTTFAADSITNINAATAATDATVIPSSADPIVAPVAVSGSSQATETHSVMDDMYISLFSNFHGPSIQNFGSNALDSKGRVSSRGINFDSNLTVAYLLTKSIGAGFEIPFFYLPGSKTSFELGDVAVKFFNKKLVTNGNFTLYGNLILQAITSDYSRSLGQDFAVKTTPHFRYLIPNSRFSFGAWTEAKAYLGAVKGKAFKLWAAPHVDYQITPKLSAIMQFEIETDHMVNAPGMLNFTTYQADFTPGIAYFITPKVMINPYVQIFTNDHIALDRTGVGAIITAAL